MSSDQYTLHKEIFVEATPEHAFRTFTENFNTWWPRDHHIGAADLDRIVIEPMAGGRWIEYGVDGSECPWGKVLAWEPPHRLLLTWQLTSQFAYDPDFVTEVEVTFTPDNNGTMVTFEHRNLDRYGENAEKQRASLDNAHGWGWILQSFANEANRVAA